MNGSYTLNYLCYNFLLPFGLGEQLLSGIDKVRSVLKTSNSDKRTGMVRNIFISLLFLCIFILIEWCSFSITRDGSHSPWRPATGISFSFGLIFFPFSSLLIFLADLISQIFIYHQVITFPLAASSLAFGLFIGLLPGFIMRVFKVNIRIHYVRDYIFISGLALLVTILTGVVSVNYDTIITGIPPTLPLHNFIFHWFRDFLGIFSLSFLILVIRDHLLDTLDLKRSSKINAVRIWQRLLMISYKKVLEFLIIIFLLGIIIFEVSRIELLQQVNPYFLVILPMIWLAIRFGRFGSSVTAISFLSIFLLTNNNDLTNLSTLIDIQVLWIIFISVTLLCGVFVSERNRLTYQLHHSEDEFKFLADTAPVGICKTDLSGVISYFNQYIFELIRTNIDTLIGVHFFDLIYPEDQATVSSMLEISKLDGKEFILSFRLSQKKKTPVWVQGTFTPQIDSNCNIQNYLITCIDITHYKEREELISTSERTLTAFLDNLPDPAWLKDKDGNYLAINREMEVLYKRDRSEFLGKDDIEVWGEKEGGFYQKTDQIVLESEKPMRFEARLFPDDDVHWYETVKTALIIDGEVFGTTGIARDISDRRITETALKESEQRLMGLLNNIPDLAWMKDRDKRVLAVNETFCKAFKFQEEEVIGKNNRDLFPKDVAEKFDIDDDEVMTLGRPKVIEEAIPNEEGYLSWYETIKMPLFDEFHHIVGITGISREITNRKRADEAYATSS